MADLAPSSDGAGPKRGYSWPPFEIGNAAALRHGAHSQRRTQPIAEQLAGHLVTTTAPWCASPAFAGAVSSWAWAEARLVLLREYLNEVGDLDEDKRVRPAVELVERTENRLVRLRVALGLEPASLTKLMESAASLATATGDAESLDAVRAEGRRILASRSGSDVES